MRRFLCLVVLSLMPACGILGPVQPAAPIAVPSTLPEAGRQAQNAINEATLGIAAAANVVRANVKDGIWTKAQAQGYLDKLGTYLKDVDRAQTALNVGNFTSAKAQADLLSSLILILHREVAAQARKEAK
jgi:hypothetical protein